MQVKEGNKQKIHWTIICLAITSCRTKTECCEINPCGLASFTIQCEDEVISRSAHTWFCKTSRYHGDHCLLRMDGCNAQGPIKGTSGMRCSVNACFFFLNVCSWIDIKEKIYIQFYMNTWYFFFYNYVAPEEKGSEASKILVTSSICFLLL